MAEYEITTAPDLSEQWTHLDGQVKALTLVANRSTDENIAADARARAEKAVGERDELEEQIAAAARIITVERIDPKAWGRIVAEHPPRRDVPWDAQMGFNTDTFDRALMPAAITSVTDGRLDPVEWNWDDLVAVMSPGKYQEIIGDTLRAHMERDAVPFSLADWRSRRPSAPSSK